MNLFKKILDRIAFNRQTSPVDSPKIISSLKELDTFLEEAREAENDDALRNVFKKFQMIFPYDLPNDPFSKEYRDQQFKFYEFLAGKPYAEVNEESVFDVEVAVANPFPFSTGSSETVGNQLMAVGHIIKTMKLPIGSKVLEFGPGWGNTTLQLARTGFLVTAIDVESRFVELIAKRAKQKQVELDVRLGTFDFVYETDEQWDAVLFFECFHHCADHIKLIKGLDNVVKPGGKVIFAAEPITDALTMPWGFRLDGESLWAIRSHGWCELGFTESYFRTVMHDNGWKLSVENCPNTPWGNIFVATRIDK